MANTVIQIKRSTVTTAPSAGSLSAAEPAYSYLSDKLFLGSSDGSEVIEIGGRYYINTAVRADQTANLALDTAIAAFDYANTISSDADEKANAAIITANAAFDAANAAYNFANTGGDALYVANLAFDKANSANLLAYNTGIGANAHSDAVGVGANAYADGVGTAANTYADAVGVSANLYADAVGTSANAYSDATFLPLAGGTITGDLVVQGNTVFSGNIVYANTQTLLIGDNIMLLNADLPSDVAPSEDAGMEVNRGTQANVSLLWDEGQDKWTFTNDGTTYYQIASNASVESSQTIAIAAFDQANAAPGIANSYAAAVGVAANLYADSVGTAANLYAAAVGTAANLYADTVGTSANAYTDSVAISVGTGANSYASAVGVAANLYAAAVGTSANAYADVVGAAANTNASDASYISTGTLAVSYGGTGLNTVANNGILFGNVTGPLRIAAAGTEGQVLQANQYGTPFFGMLDGGSF